VFTYKPKRNSRRRRGHRSRLSRVRIDSIAG
jgi:ribosomal protein L21